MVTTGVARHMSSVQDYRERLATLRGSWDTLSLLSHLGGDGADMSGTRQAFDALAADLIGNLGEATYRKALVALKAKGQIAIDIMVRNLYERTADIGFLATDEAIRDYLRQRRTKGGEALAACDQELRRHLREYIGKYSVYHDVILLGADGEVLLRLDEQQAVARTGHVLLGQTLTTRHSYVETFGKIDLLPAQERSLIYSFRVNDGNNVLCLCFRFDDEVHSIFTKLRAASDWTAFCFLDERGTVIASSDPWQVPCGAPMPLALDEGGRILRFAGREYLAITRRAHGYQGYFGPGWYAHAMLPIEHAFDHHAEDAAAQIPDQLLTELLESQTIFSAALREIPRRAEEIQRELSRMIWNGNVRLADNNSADGDFTKILLREIGHAGRRTQETFERSIHELQETVVSAILDDAQLLAALCVDVLDRNLYERVNDCRWLALNGTVAGALAGAVSREQASAVLRHINSLCTVYHSVVLFDADGCIVAVSNAAHESKIGAVIDEGWVAATLTLRNSQQYAASAFAPSALYDNRHTLVFGAAIRNADGNAIGGIGIVFDSAPQLAAMLRDASPRTESGAIASDSIAAFVDADLRVIAATSNLSPGDVLGLPRDLLREPAAATRIVTMNGSHYAAGIRQSSGYREYAGMGVFGVILIPLGRVAAQAKPLRRLHQQGVQRLTGIKEQTVDIATFYCADQRLGMMRDEIIEALDGAHIRPVPKSPPWYAGLLMYREAPLPIIDLARLMGDTIARSSRNVIVTRTAGSEQLFGLLVDELADIPEIAVSRILSVAELSQRGGPAILDRAVRPEQPADAMLLILNVNQLLTYARTAGFPVAPPAATVRTLKKSAAI